MTREDKLAAAGDYVLGTLEGTDRTAFEATMANDPELADMVADLSERLLALDAIDDTEAPPALWARIEAALDAPASGAEATPARAAAHPHAARQTTMPASGWMALAASVVVALGLGYLLGAQSVTAPEPTVIAVLLNEDDASPAVVVEAFGDDSVHLVPLETFDVPEGRILEVWTLPDEETGPVSLGTLDQAREVRLEGPDLPVPQSGQLYEITLEEAPGSPTGRPTGPILVKGFARPPVH